MVNFKVDMNIEQESFIHIAKDYGKSAAKETAEKIYSESQQNCPVKSGALKQSGYIKDIGADGYEVGYSAEYAEYVDKMPQSWLTHTGHGGKTHFFSNAVQNNSGGGPNAT